MVPVSKYEMSVRLQKRADIAARKRIDSTRHRCFVSYHVADTAEVETFLDNFGSEFLGTCVGITERDDFINSAEPEYIKRRIRELYLANTTVTIVLLGQCTWSRQFVDWEISSTLRDDPKNARSGLLAIPLPSKNGSAVLPPRVHDNFDPENLDKSYARFLRYPNSPWEMRRWIEMAYQNRFDKSKVVNNTRDLFRANRDCAQG